MKKIFLLSAVFLFILAGCSNEKLVKKQNLDDIDLKYEADSYENSIISKLSANIDNTPKEEKIGEFTTKIYDKDPDRQHNLELTCSKINEHIVKTGETFSFEDTVGQASPKEGYEKAKIFDKNGNVKEGYGGGKCQVSTTLFNAVRNLAGIEIVERHDHSNKVPYAKTGDDAAVAHGGYDFKFKNNNNFDLKILAGSDKENITVTINKIDKNNT